MTYVLFREGVDKLGKDLVGDNSLSELVRVVGETAKSQSALAKPECLELYRNIPEMQKW